MSKEFLADLLTEIYENGRPKRHALDEYEDIQTYEAAEIVPESRNAIFTSFSEYLANAINFPPLEEVLPNDKPLIWPPNLPIRRLPKLIQIQKPGISKVRLRNNQRIVPVGDHSLSLPANFDCSIVKIESPHLDISLDRVRYTVKRNEFTDISFNGNKWRLDDSHMSRVWLHQDGLGIIFLTNTRKVFSFRTEDSVPVEIATLPLSFGGLYGSKVFFDVVSRVAVFLETDSIIGVFKEGKFVGSFFVPIFPVALWPEIESLTQISTPEDAVKDLEGWRPKFRNSKDLRSSLDYMIKTSRHGSKRQRVLQWLKSKGYGSIDDVLDEHPSAVISDINSYKKAINDVSGIIDSEIDRKTAWDPLGLEAELMKLKSQKLGWPAHKTQRSDSGNWGRNILYAESLDALVPRSKGARLRVEDVTIKSGSGIEILLRGGFILHIDQNLQPMRLHVPYFGANVTDEDSNVIDLDNYDFGPLSAELMGIYSKSFTGEELTEDEINLIPHRGISNVYSKNLERAQIMEILRSGGTYEEAESLDAKDRKALGVLQLRLAGETLDSIGEKFGVTRERVRQIITKYGGEEFKSLQSEREDMENSQKMIRTQEIRTFIHQHPGITYEELVDEFKVSKELIVSQLTKFETKLILGSRKIWNGEKKWSDEAVLQALRDAQVYFFPLTTSAYEKLVSLGEVKGPSVPLINQRFKTWKQACIAAGVEFVESQTHYSIMWTRDELVEVLGKFLVDPSTLGSVADYETWRSKSLDRVPSTALIRNVVGGWPAACDEALSNIRLTSWDSEYEF